MLCSLPEFRERTVEVVANESGAQKRYAENGDDGVKPNLPPALSDALIRGSQGNVHVQEAEGLDFGGMGMALGGRATRSIGDGIHDGQGALAAGEPIGAKRDRGITTQGSSGG